MLSASYAKVGSKLSTMSMNVIRYIYEGRGGIVADKAARRELLVSTDRIR